MNSQPLFKKVDTNIPLVFRVVNQIEDMIFEGKLKDGDRLPPEREFADIVGVSRSVVREAVQILVSKGLLKSKRKVGTVVQKLTRNHIVTPITMFLKTHTKEVTAEQLYQVRHLLEIEIAGIAAAEAEAADIEYLKKILKRLEASDEDRDLFCSIDDEFHCALAQTTHNPLLVILIESVQGLMINLNKQSAKDPKMFKIAKQHHGRIIDMIEKRDPEGARRVMKTHLEYGLETFQKARMSSGVI